MIFFVLAAIWVLMAGICVAVAFCQKNGRGPELGQETACKHSVKSTARPRTGIPTCTKAILLIAAIVMLLGGLVTGFLAWQEHYQTESDVKRLLSTYPPITNEVLKALLENQDHYRMLSILEDLQEGLRRNERLTQVSTGLAWKTALFMGGALLVLIGLGIGIFTTGGAFPGRVPAICLSVGTLLTVSSLLKVEAGGVRVDFYFGRHTPPDTVVVRQTTALGERLVVRDHGAFGPFETGCDTLLNAEALRDTARAIGSSLAGNHLQLLLVIGQADKRFLHGNLQRSYDTNAGLAQARANWVRQQLLRDGALSGRPMILTLPAAATYTGLGHDDDLLAADRYVHIIGLWQRDAALK